MTGACGICAGALRLRHPGVSGGLTPAALSPTCHAVGGHGDLYRCARCGTLQQPERPPEGTLVDLYRAMRDDAYLAEEPGRRATARRLLARIERRRGPGRLLDVGCAHGLLLDEARRRGWGVTGLEVAADAAAHARSLGLDVREAPVEALDADGRFDAIVLADVIEHLDDPVATVGHCARLLAAGGVLCVVTPDPASHTARLAGARWWALLPGHTFLLPRATLRAVLAGEGLEPVDDVSLWRTFSLAYWLSGLGERAGSRLGRAVAKLAHTPAGALPVTLSLGDERVVIARAP